MIFLVKNSIVFFSRLRIHQGFNLYQNI